MKPSGPWQFCQTGALLNSKYCMRQKYVPASVRIHTLGSANCAFTLLDARMTQWSADRSVTIDANVWTLIRPTRACAMPGFDGRTRASLGGRFAVRPRSGLARIEVWNWRQEFNYRNAQHLTDGQYSSQPGIGRRTTLRDSPPLILLIRVQRDPRPLGDRFLRESQRVTSPSQVHPELPRELGPFGRARGVGTHYSTLKPRRVGCNQ